MRAVFLLLRARLGTASSPRVQRQAGGMVDKIASNQLPLSCACALGCTQFAGERKSITLRLAGRPCGLCSHRGESD